MKKFIHPNAITNLCQWCNKVRCDTTKFFKRLIDNKGSVRELWICDSCEKIVLADIERVSWKKKDCSS